MTKATQDLTSRLVIGLIVLSWGFGIGPVVALATGSDEIGLFAGLFAIAFSLFAAISIFRFGVP